MGLSVKLIKRVTDFTLDVAWEIGNELTVLFGDSGAGKSMTLQCIAGLMEPETGYVRVNGDIFFDRRLGINILPQKRSLGYVFQDRALFPHMTVAGNIAYGLNGLRKAEIAERVHETIHLFHLEGLGKSFPAEISGGQKQRVALARALIRSPKALLLDEPFSGLHNDMRCELMELVKGIRKQTDIPIVLVTHDVFEARTMADKVIAYAEGKNFTIGPFSEVLVKTDMGTHFSRVTRDS